MTALTTTRNTKRWLSKDELYKDAIDSLVDNFSFALTSDRLKFRQLLSEAPVDKDRLFRSVFYDVYLIGHRLVESNWTVYLVKNDFKITDL